jgi:phenylacetate-CoA ligase
VLLTLPPSLASGGDCLTALLDFGVLTLSRPAADLDEVQRFAPTVLIGTPTDMMWLGRLAATRHVDLADGPIRVVVVTGEPGGSVGSTRRRIEEWFGSHCLDLYASTECGVLGWGCTANPAGLHLNEADFAIETIDPDGEGAVSDGRLAELVVTSRKPAGVPLARYRTGDLVRLHHGACACGNASVKADGGVLGRVTERMLVRGHELLPSDIEQVVRRHPAVAEYHLRVYQVRGHCEVAVEIEPDDVIASEGDRARVAAEVGEDLKRSLGLRLQTDVVAPDSLRAQDSGRRARRLSRQ